MTATSRAIPAFLAFVSGALLVWGVRALRAPPGLAEEPPVAGALPTPPAEDPDEAAPAREPSAGDTTPADLGSTPEIPVVAGPPAPPPPKILDLAALTDEQLWARGNAGGPDVGIPARVAALEELLRRSLPVEDRVRTLKTLAFQLRALAEPSTRRQVEVLEEAIRLAGPESPQGHEASIQLAWPLWELVRRDEAVDTARRVASSPRASARHRGLAEWALLVFALEQKDMVRAEEHFERLLAVREPMLASTQTLARQRMAAARARR